VENISLSESIKTLLLDIQEAFGLWWQGFLSAFSRPFYVEDTLEELEAIGVGSLPVILLTSFFTGAVFALQTTDILRQYGSAASMGQLVSFTMIRELGPVLTALMFTGRVGAGIASEIGGMVVSQQVDALRALGTDYMKKLIAPRILACIISLPVLTAICDLVGTFSGQILTTFQIHQNPHVYWNSVQSHLKIEDFYYSFFKAIAFGIIVAMVACYQGLKTSGGTRGVGRSTTYAVMTSSILIIASDFFLTKAINLLIAYGPHH